MNDGISNIKTGIFVFIGVVLFIGSILFYSGDRSFFSRYNKYKIKLTSAQGLGVGSVVSLSGKTIGNVSDINFAQDGSLIADIRIKNEYEMLLSDKSLASLRTQGALGDKYIFINPGPMSENKLKENDFIANDPQPDFIDLISEKASDLAVFSDALKELNQLLFNLNSNNKSRLLMENLVDTSKNVSKLMSDPELKGSIKHLSSVLKKIDNGHGTLGSLINDSSLYDKLVGLMGEAPRNKYLKPLLRETIIQNEKKR